MNVNATGSMEQMQMRKMDGSGGGHGKGGMQDIMQSLSTEDQALMKEQRGSMTMEERMTAVSQMKEVDKAAMSDQEYVQTLLDLIDTSTTNEAEADGFSVYA